MTVDEARSEAARVVLLAMVRERWLDQPQEVLAELDLICKWLRRRLAGSDKLLAKVMERELGREVKLGTKRRYRPS